MIDPAKSDLELLAQRLTAVAAQLADVNERLGEVEYEIHDQPDRNKSTLCLGEKKSARTEHKMYNPEAGP
jgi:hypothetical protein